MPLYQPHDPFPYPPDPFSRIAHAALSDGVYAYVQDINGNVWVLPDQPHVHPRILGRGQSVLYAGDLGIQSGEVTDITNLSGTFQCDDPTGLLIVVDQLVRHGLTIRAAAVRYFPADGSPPRVLR